VALDWRGFELHPETPRGGMELTQLFPASRLAGMADHLRRFSAQFGVEPLAPRSRLANTRRALAVAEYARDVGKLDAWRDAASHAYWREDSDLESDAALGAIAARVGLDVDAAVAAADDAALQSRIDAKRDEASRLGITGIPTFVFAGRRAVVGCQPYEVLAAAVEREAQ